MWKTKEKGAYSKTKGGNLKRNRDVGTKSASLKLSRDVEMKRGKRGGGEQLLGGDAQRNWVLTESACQPQSLMLCFKIFSSVFKHATLQHLLFNLLLSLMLRSKVFSCISNIINATLAVKDHSNCRIFHYDWCHTSTSIVALLQDLPFNIRTFYHHGCHALRSPPQFSHIVPSLMLR